MRKKLSDGLIIAFLVLTLFHTQHVLSLQEVKDFGWLAWALSVGIDVGTAYAAFIAADKTAPGFTRIISAFWLVCLLFVSYGLNYAYYFSVGNKEWAWALAAIFPGSLAFLGAIKAGLERETVQTQPAQEHATAPAPIAHHYAPPAADSGGDAIEDATDVQPELVNAQAVYDAVVEEEINPREIARQLRKDGGSWDEIATALGKSKRTVQLWVNGR